MTVHKSVLLEESIEGLNLKNGSVVVDATLGGGGHSLEILKNILPDGKLIAIDQDSEAIEEFKNNSVKLKLKKENLKIIRDNFSNIEKVLSDQETVSVDAILADLGISSDQIENAKRGFSFQEDAELDMRMNQESELTAKKVVNTYSEEDLRRILWEYGEERYAGLIAKKIIEKREEKPIVTTLELVKVINEIVPERYKHQKIHQATRTFQALRIEVNQELENLNKFIRSSIGLLNSGGRLVIISFHSLEDRIVKNIFRENARGCICPPDFPVCRCSHKPTVRIVTKKPIIPSNDEIEENRRARSAKLRIVEKI